MPVHQADTGEQVIEFGHGDIGIAHGTHPDLSAPTQLILFRGKPGEVGRKITDVPRGTPSSALPVIVRLAFANRQSLRVLIEELQGLENDYADLHHGKQSAGVPDDAGEAGGGLPEGVPPLIVG